MYKTLVICQKKFAKLFCIHFCKSNLKGVPSQFVKTSDLTYFIFVTPHFRIEETLVQSSSHPLIIL